MAVPDRVVFTISIPRTLPEDTWQTFAAKTRADGSDPKGIIRRLIEYYNEKGMPHDAKETDASRDLRTRQHE